MLVEKNDKYQVCKGVPRGHRGPKKCILCFLMEINSLARAARKQLSCQQGMFLLRLSNTICIIGKQSVLKELVILDSDRKNS